MYRKRIKMTKLPSFKETLEDSVEIVKLDLGREPTSREIKYIKRYIYSIRKKIIKGYIQMDIGFVLKEIDAEIQSFMNSLYDRA